MIDLREARWGRARAGRLRWALAAGALGLAGCFVDDPVPKGSTEEPSCRTSGPERAPTDAWVRELEARADATREAEDVRKAMKAALVLLVYEDQDCWEIRDRFDALCGKANAATVSPECQQWWDRTSSHRSERGGRG